MFEPAWSLDTLELFRSHVALHAVRCIHRLVATLGGCLIDAVNCLDHGEYVVTEWQTLVLLAGHTQLLPTIQGARQSVFVHEDIVGSVRCGVITFVLVRPATRPLEAALLELVGLGPRHAHRIVMTAGTASVTWPTLERAYHRLSTQICTIGTNQHLGFGTLFLDRVRIVDGRLKQLTTIGLELSRLVRR